MFTAEYPIVLLVDFLVYFPHNFNTYFFRMLYIFTQFVFHLALLSGRLFQDEHMAVLVDKCNQFQTSSSA